MFEAFAATVCLVCLGVSRWTMRQAQAISPLFLFALISIVFINIGFIVYFNDRSMSDFASSATALLSVNLGLGAVVVGAISGSILLRLDPSAWRNIQNLELRTDITVGNACVVAVVVYLVSLFPFLLQGSVPLLDALVSLPGGGITDNHMNILRNNADPYLSPDAVKIPLQGFFDAIRYGAVPVVCLWFLWFFRKGDRRALCCLFFAAGLLVTMASGQRWPLLFSIVSVIVFVSCTEPDPAQYRKLLSVLVVTSVGLGVLLSTLLARSSGGGDDPIQAVAYGFTDLFKRLFLGNIDAPFTCYSFFPTRYDWLMGEGYLQNLACFVPRSGEKKGSFAVTLYKLLYNNEAFTAPPDMYTEAYVNFGIPGVLSVSFVCGLLLTWLQRAMVRARGLVGSTCLTLVVVNVAFSVISGIFFFINAVVACLFLLMLVRLTGPLFGWRAPGSVTSWSTAGLDAGTIRGPGHPLESH